MKNHILMLPKSRGVADSKPLALEWWFYDTAVIAFSGRQNKENLLIGCHVFFSQGTH
jgi:hypothetical protein